MPDSGRSLVINTTPLITLAVATNGLDVLRLLYDRVVVPMEVGQEILAAGNFSARSRGIQ
jgi:predicted nucleic acid-binding protein